MSLTMKMFDGASNHLISKIMSRTFLSSQFFSRDATVASEKEKKEPLSVCTVTSEVMAIAVASVTGRFFFLHLSLQRSTFLFCLHLLFFSFFEKQNATES